MEFLTSRINDKSNDKHISHSARSLSSLSFGSSHLSSQSYDSSSTSVRHINTAEFIEKVALLDALSEDNVKYATLSETQTDIVPPLDIKSEENYPTTRDYTFSYRKHCGTDKTTLKPDKAFETWLSAKRKLLSDEAAKRKKEQEMKQKVMEERKRLAKEKYDVWLQKKSQSSVTLQSIDNHVEKSNTNNVDNRTHSKLSADEVRVRLEEWERAKRIKEEQRRARKRQEELQRRELEEQRRQMAVEAWENWVSNADKKPKPVPLNRGIFTLRGTVSDIFVNPNEWKPIIPVSNEDN